ncbi:hypothetical protein PENTCL1PPCAC_12017, partial [Pristionchus entomophagus]
VHRLKTDKQLLVRILLGFFTSLSALFVLIALGIDDWEDLTFLGQVLIWGLYHVWAKVSIPDLRLKNCFTLEESKQLKILNITSLISVFSRPFLLPHSCRTGLHSTQSSHRDRCEAAHSECLKIIIYHERV